MQFYIGGTYLLFNTTLKIWNAVSFTYSKVSNDVQIYELRNKVHSIKQGELIISQYFYELNEL